MFLQLDERWLDVMACGAPRRDAFLDRAWGAAASAGRLRPGDAVFFYTQRIHRAPPAPPAGSPRYTLFGAFCAAGKSESVPFTAETYQERWAAFDGW